MNAFLSGLFPDHTSAQRAIAELRRTMSDGARIGVLLRRGPRSAGQSTREGGANAPGTHVAGDDATLLAPLGATSVSANGYFLAGGVLADRMRDATDGNADQALAALAMPPEEVRQTLDRVEQGAILVLVEGVGMESPLRQVMLAAGATNLADAPVRSQIRRNAADAVKTVEPLHVAEGPGTETASLHHSKAHSIQRARNEERARTAARGEEIANMETGADQENISTQP